MIGNGAIGALGLALCAGATALVAPSPAMLAEFGAWAARPAVLPFAWHALGDAERRGDAAEVFARAQQMFELLPRWVDGQAAFAYRYALAAGGTAEPASVALRRLDAALAWLAAARTTAGRREADLLQAMAFLPEVAVRQQPGLELLLAPRGGAAGLADACYAELEQRFPSAARSEQRLFFAPILAASLLAAGDLPRARSVLQAAIARADRARDQTLAAPFRQRLGEVLRWLDGDRSLDLAAVRADARMVPLLPHLR
jgi:hypothetical protein